MCRHRRAHKTYGSTVSCVQFEEAGWRMAPRGVCERCPDPGACIPAYPRLAVEQKDATLVSDQPLTNVFMAVLVFDSGFLSGHTDRPRTQIILHDVPDLAAGQETRVKFSAAAFQQRAGSWFFPLLFSDGAEIRTALAEYSDGYFNRIERLQHQAQLAAYREKFATANHAAVPTVMIRPVFPDGVEMPHDGTPHTARLFVGEDGMVNDLDITPTFEPVVNREIIRALRGWLFLPKLVDGEPVVAQIKIPLQ